MSKHNGPYPTHPSKRFWSKVAKAGPTECWNWTGARLPAPNGYGFMYAGVGYAKGVRWIRAHRLSWEIHNGPIPNGLSVLHHCDNQLCVNPAHLYVGTQQENMRDRAERGRGKYQNGEAATNAKLTEADVRAVDALLKTGASQTEIAAMFGIKQPQVSRIALRQTWRHLWEE